VPPKSLVRPDIHIMEHLNVAWASTRYDLNMTKESRKALNDIRMRDKALSEVATRAEAVAALNDCRTLLAIIDELQIDESETTRLVA
jgi:hypothetical protein